MTDLRLIRGNAPEPEAEKPTNFSQTVVMNGQQNLSKPASTTALNVPINKIEPGTTLANYLIVSKLGEGGMGVVYKAHDTTLDRTVALKVLSPHLFRNQEFLQRFRIEAQAQARLNGPNIVTLHSLFEISGSLVLVMEYIEGQTLEQRIHNEGHLSVATTVWVFEQALLGVERAHRLGIVHRDLKPSNIFITSAHEIKLMDFGVAKIMDNQESTQAGSMIGTLMYISPEQVRGKEADFRSDIYTLGITLFEAVTGRLPFEKKTDYEYMDAHLHEAPPRPSEIKPDIPAELEALILKAIEKDPENRFQNAHEFRSALIKLGMTHVRAYRRLKTIRRDKDRAAYNHYAHAPAKGALPAAPAEQTGSLRSRIKPYAWWTAIASMPILGAALTAGYFFLANPAGQAELSQEVSKLEPQEGVNREGLANAAGQTELNAASGGAVTPAVAQNENQVPAANNRTRVSSPPQDAKRTAAPQRKPRTDKYKSLRKAWGGD